MLGLVVPVVVAGIAQTPASGGLQGNKTLKPRRTDVGDLL